VTFSAPPAPYVGAAGAHPDSPQLPRGPGKAPCGSQFQCHFSGRRIAGESLGCRALATIFVIDIQIISIIATLLVGKMRQTLGSGSTIELRSGRPDWIPAHRQKGLCNRDCSVASHDRHSLCFGVSSDHRLSTQQTWKPSRPNSRNTGLLAKGWQRTSARALAGRIRYPRRSRKPWRNSPGASAPLAASTDHLIRIGRRGLPTLPPQEKTRRVGSFDPPCPLSSSRRAFFCIAARPAPAPDFRQTATGALIDG
jgi:hypothetical protein